VLEAVLVVGVRQQASPAFAPHKAQTPLEHFVPDAVHAVPVETLVLVLVLQQGLPGPPQAPELQLPLLHVPGNGKQLAPLATQIFEAQQPLFAQELPAQQIWPGPPQPTVTAPPEPPAAFPPAPMSVPPEPALPPPAPGGVVTMLVLEPPAPPLPGSTMVPPSPARRPPSPSSPIAPPFPPPKPLPLESLHPWKAKAKVATTREEMTDNHFTVLCVRMGRLLRR
jgi:hypothetical protein